MKIATLLIDINEYKLTSDCVSTTYFRLTELLCYDIKESLVINRIRESTREQVREALISQDDAI